MVGARKGGWRLTPVTSRDERDDEGPTENKKEGRNGDESRWRTAEVFIYVEPMPSDDVF